MCLALDAPRSALLTWLVTEIPERFEYHGRVVFYYLVVWKRLETEGSDSLARDWNGGPKLVCLASQAKARVRCH